jgi:hypothetical protein
MIFKRKDNAMCVYCVHSKKSDTEDYVFCNKKRKQVKEHSSCLKYEYDIFKREVKRKKKPDFSYFSEEDFRL